MSSQTAMSVLAGVEFVLWAVLAFLFRKKALQRRFPAMGYYLALRVISTPVLLVLFYGQAEHWFRDLCFPIYFFLYWGVFVASAVILFFICTEVFRAALSTFSGLIKLGIVVFRWAAVASLVVSFSTISISRGTVMLVSSIANGLMRSVSILELCLLAFLCISMNALLLSPRDLAFGISLGFGVLSANDFLQSLLTTNYTSLTDPIQFMGEGVILAGLGMWVVYFALPEPVRKPVVMPANSTIYRWNEIASALGHTGTQVAVQQPVNSFFLTDVEKVVEKVLTRNLKSHESES
jgi:hypothetical protein